jgi:hypothetical protein
MTVLVVPLVEAIWLAQFSTGATLRVLLRLPFLMQVLLAPNRVQPWAQAVQAEVLLVQAVQGKAQGEQMDSVACRKDPP